MISVEESFRGHVLDLVRSRDDALNWGDALKLVLDKFAVHWSDASHILAAGRASMVRAPMVSASVVPVSDRSGKVCPCTENAASKRICKAYNDARGCPKPCKKGGVHCCDIELATGACCGMSHPRNTHEAGKHGMPKYRSN